MFLKIGYKSTNSKCNLKILVICIADNQILLLYDTGVMHVTQKLKKINYFENIKINFSD